MNVSYRSARWLACIFVMSIVTQCSQHAYGSMASYVFLTHPDNNTYLWKFNGLDLNPDGGQFSSGALVASGQSSGSGISLIGTGSFAAVVNPGVYGNGLSDVQATVTGSTTWLSPQGRHGQLSSGPNFGIYRGTATAGVPGYTLFDGTQGIGMGIQMGDFAHDIFSGGADGRTYIGAHNGSGYLDLGAFTITQRVQAGSGAIIQKSTGDIYYVEPDGSEALIPGVTSMDNSIGGKIGSQYAIFNADGSTWLYDTVTNSVMSQSGANITAFVRVGSQAIVQFSSAAYTLDSDANYSNTAFANGANRITGSVSFGDYAMFNLDSTTQYIRDIDGSSYEMAQWSGALYDLSLATGGYIGVVSNIPEPSGLALLSIGIAGLFGFTRRCKRNS